MSYIDIFSLIAGAKMGICVKIIQVERKTKFIQGEKSRAEKSDLKIMPLPSR